MDAEAYGLLDRAVHRLAFGSGPGRAMMRDLETRLFGGTIARQPIESPVFITALPRAGTTLLLEILAAHPQLATQSYRDMPFVLSPVMWQHLSGRFRAKQSRRERAHGDGLKVNADSPEAFEEVLWLDAFPEHYAPDGIIPWPEGGAAIRAPLADLMRRLIAARAPDAEAPVRYLSKNNANIARLGALRAAFGDARLLVPLRPPLDHAVSLHCQHLRFLDLHRQSAFARRYMADIGHFEFGALHRPILVEGKKAARAHNDPKTPDYWLDYWVRIHRHIARHPNLFLLDMEAFTATPDIAGLLACLGLRPDAGVNARAGALIRQMTRRARPEGIDPDLLAEATELYRALAARSILTGTPRAA